eukprot:1161071-Pelagomonas_calceolata.AAC.6
MLPRTASIHFTILGSKSCIQRITGICFDFRIILNSALLLKGVGRASTFNGWNYIAISAEGLSVAMEVCPRCRCRPSCFAGPKDPETLN